MSAVVLKLIMNAATVVAWVLGIFLSVFAVSKGSKLKEEMGVSFGMYMTLVGVTEVIYSVSALLILSAMGINVVQYLVELNFRQALAILQSFDVTTIQIVGVLGWVGFVINRLISYVSPLYLLIAGGKKLHRYFVISAWTEITLETTLTVALFWILYFK